MPQTDGFAITAKPAVYFGPGAIGELPGVIRAAGADQAVVVTEAALASAPAVETVLAVLADAGLVARLFAGVHPRPAPGDLAAGAEAVARAAADAATSAAASASAAAVTAMLRPSAPLVPPAPAAALSHPSGPYPVLRPSGPDPAPHPSGPYPLFHPSGRHPAPHPSAPHPAPHPSGHHPSAPPDSGPAVPRIVLVAVGGRAPVDAAKGIAAASEPALPIVAVPVTAGTGAETSAVGLVTDPADGRTFRVGHAGTMPAAAILDPDLAIGLPPAVTAGCGLDALARALESYLSLRPNPWSDGIALQVIRMVAASLPRAVLDGADQAARSQLLLAGYMAGVAAATTGLGLCHAIAWSLSAHQDTAHRSPASGEHGDPAYGAVLAALLPEVLRFNLPACVGRMADVAFALGVGDTHADTWLNAEAAIGAVTALRGDVGLNRLIGDFGVSEADFGRIAAGALADEALAGAPRPPAEDDIRAILLAAGQSR